MQKPSDGVNKNLSAIEEPIILKMFAVVEKVIRKNNMANEK
jgi:hypothetical protein